MENPERAATETDKGIPVGSIFLPCIEIFFLTLFGSASISVMTDLLVPSIGGYILFWSVESSLIISAVSIVLQISTFALGKKSSVTGTLNRDIAEAHLAGLFSIAVVTIASAIVCLTSSFGDNTTTTTWRNGQSYMISPQITWTQASVGESSWARGQGNHFVSSTQLTGPSTAGFSVLVSMLAYLVLMLMVASYAVFSATPYGKGAPLFLDPAVILMTNIILCVVAIPGIYSDAQACAFPVVYAILSPTGFLLVSVVLYFALLPQLDFQPFRFTIILACHCMAPILNTAMQWSPLSVTVLSWAISFTGFTVHATIDYNRPRNNVPVHDGSPPPQQGSQRNVETTQPPFLQPGGTLRKREINQQSNNQSQHVNVQRMFWMGMNNAV